MTDEQLQPFIDQLDNAYSMYADGINRNASSPTEIAERRTIAKMELDLKVAPEMTVTAYATRTVRLSTGVVLSGARAWFQEHSDEQFNLVSTRQGALAKKEREYSDLAKSLTRDKTIADHVLRDKYNGIVYFVQENAMVVKIIQAVIDALREWFLVHAYDEDFLNVSAEDALSKLLEIRQDFDIAFRIAQTFPKDTEKSIEAVQPSGQAIAREVIVGLIPFVGSAAAIYEIIAGRDLSGYALTNSERAILGVFVFLPAAARWFKAGKAVYTTERMVQLYGRDVRTMQKTLSLSQRVGQDLASLRKLEKAVEDFKISPTALASEEKDVMQAIVAALSKQPAKTLAGESQALKSILSKFSSLSTLDEIALSRVLEKGINNKTTTSAIDAMSGQLLEEILESSIMNRVRTKGLQALGIKVKGVVEFIPGHMITDAAGNQLTDGILLARTRLGIEVLGVFEAKAGRSSATKLYKELKPLSKRLQLEREKELAGSAKISNRELGGQVRRTIERLSPGTSGDFENITAHDLELTSIFIGSGEGKLEAKVYMSPTRTKVFGVLPGDVSAGRIRKNLRDLGYDFEILKMDISSKELREICAELLNAQ